MKKSTAIEKLINHGMIFDACPAHHREESQATHTNYSCTSVSVHLIKEMNKNNDGLLTLIQI